MKFIIRFALIALLAAFAAGCGALDVGGSGGSALQKAKEEGVIKVGFANEKPYAYRTEDGKVTGEAVEIARHAFKQMGIERIEPVLTDFGQLIPGLKAKRFDAITAGMYITPERCKEVAFANPEYKIGQALAVKKGNPKNLHSYEDIVDNSDVTVAVMQGAIEKQYLKQVGVKESQIKTVQDQPAALAMLKTGRVDAITMTGPALREVLKAEGDDGVETVEDFKQPIIDGESIVGYGATAFRKDDKELLEAYNREIQKMQEGGKLLEILKQFNFAEENLPGDKTAEELCKG
ncbi:amino acid ABC transporter substrate-binding protein (PAAT family) [Planifilum fimeticola]|uniref:Amino acid ABC transporter substrate-binding protein (PAAT family) n=1 Tax=Planifilum fimeticola TaxID=201975 RepID=A0A2T0LD87_9BACL|nr:ectoine/hydroxyectoine ABC transporter substrate-binding protein EhuB [Planifilum fimeticola]PRX40026.1 amino acid ABC transporter substrate-binding protein (PAAT family) [Planifilum fimeticola]